MDFISCSDRLPAENIKVMCITRKGLLKILHLSPGAMEYKRDKDWAGEVVSSVIQRYKFDDITHWAPLFEIKTCDKLHKYTGKQCLSCNRDRMTEIRRLSGIPERKRNYTHKESQQRSRDRVTLYYAASKMRVKVGDVPVEMLEAKCALIRLKRKLRDEKNGS